MNSLLLNVICAFAIANTSPNAERAQQTLDALYKNYAAPNTCLLRENYPSDQNNKATYLASEEQAKRHNEYSYLWPYSGTFSAVNALLESTGNKKYKKLLENKVLPGLEEYFDTRREPFAYSSYISNQPLSDRFYDDNVWLGIDFTDSYRMTKKQAYLEKAELIWEFILSGKDEVLGGGIYWCEQKKESKNTCSNAPGAVFALKLFQATQDSTYLKQGKELYEWTKKNLEDPTDHLYFDNIALNKKIGRAKFAYNSGQMMQADEQPVADITSKQIGNARSYITKNLNQLIGFVEAGNTDKADALRAKVNERVQLLITAKAEITADTIAKLQQAGITVEQQASADGEEQPESAEEEVTDEGEADTASPEATPAE